MFERLLNRMSDVHPDIRIAVVGVACKQLAQLESDPESHLRVIGETSCRAGRGGELTLCAPPSEMLHHRIADPSEKVRTATIQSLEEAATEDVTVVPKYVANRTVQCSVPTRLRLLYHVIGERTRDRKIGVRLQALMSLTRLFAKHCSPFWREGKSLPSGAKRLQHVPKCILHAYSSHRSEQALLVWQRSSLVADLVLAVLLCCRWWTKSC